MNFPVLRNFFNQGHIRPVNLNKINFLGLARRHFRNLGNRVTNRRLDNILYHLFRIRHYLLRQLA